MFISNWLENQLNETECDEADYVQELLLDSEVNEQEFKSAVESFVDAYNEINRVNLNPVQISDSHVSVREIDEGRIYFDRYVPKFPTDWSNEDSNYIEDEDEPYYDFDEEDLDEDDEDED